MSEMEPPLSPRERILREADDPDELPLSPQAQAEVEARARRQQWELAQSGAQIDATWAAEDPRVTEEMAEAPEVMTAIELEELAQKMEQILAAEAPIIEKLVAADDVLQGTVMVLGLGFHGDIQMLVLKILRDFRQLNGYRH